MYGDLKGGYRRLVDFKRDLRRAGLPCLGVAVEITSYAF